MQMKKNAVAVAVALASSGALANSITVTPAAYSAEALLDATNDVVQAAQATVTVASSPSLMVRDRAFTLDFGKATKNAAGGAFVHPDTIALDYRTWLPAGIADTMATNATLAAISADGSAVLGYTITSAPVFHGTWGQGATASLAFPVAQPLAPYFATDGLTDTSLIYTFKPDAFSTNAFATDTETVLDVQGSQISSGTHNFAKVINVEALKKEFIANNVSADNTTLNLTIATNGLAATVNKADIGTIGFVVTGQDFSWLDSDTTDTDTAATGLDTGNLAITGGTITKLTATTIEGTINDNTAGATITVTNGEELVIPTQTGLSVAFTAYTATADEAVAVTGAGGGAWTLNGSSIDVYAVPQSANASVFMWLTNTGTGSVGIDTTIFDGSQTCEMTSIATSVAGTELDLSAAIAAAVPVQCPTYVASGNRVRYNVTANAPAATIRISAAYRVGTDRVNLVTSSEAGL
jgi:hypothetical protein